MKRMSALFAALLTATLCLSACGTASSTPENSEPEKSAENSTFQPVESKSVSEPEKSFDETNILSFELTKRDDTSYKETIATFTVSNNSSESIHYFSVDFAYCDTDGNILSDDGRFNDFGIPANKTAAMKTYSSIEGSSSKENIADIKVTSYEYVSSGKRYKIDLDNKKSKASNYEAEADADFEQSNVISFEYEEKGISTGDSYEVGVKATNTSSKPVTYVSIDMAYFDSEGNLLDKDGRFNDNTINQGNFVTIRSFLTDEDYSYNVGSYGVYSYEYRLAEDDENGFNHYDINLQTKEVSGMHVDY